jgi:hypothetical protein
MEGVLPCDPMLFAALRKLHRGVGSRGVEEPMVNRASDPRGPDQRFIDEAGEGFCNIETTGSLSTGNRDGIVQRERPNERRQAAENPLFLRGEEVVAPVEHGLEGLMPWQCAPAPLPEEPEAVVEEVGSAADAVGADPPCREFDREGNAIETAADARDDWGIGIRELKSVTAGCGALHEELHGRRGHRVGGLYAVLRRALEGQQEVNVLALDAKGLAGRGEEMNPRRLVQRAAP